MTKFSSLPVPSPVDPETTMYSLDDFPDLSLFEHCEVYPAISVPKQRTADFRKIFKDDLNQKVKNVHPDPTDADRRIIVLKT